MDFRETTVSGMEAVDLRKEDEASRRLAQTVFDRPLILEAGAGTGKTTALVSRIVSWSMGPGWDRAREELEERESLSADPIRGGEQIAARVLDGVAAITFTEAAAAEMSERIASALSQLRSGSYPLGLLPEVLPPSPGERSKRAGALLGALDHLTVCTIHAFCMRILSEHPLEASLHPSFSVDGSGLSLSQVVREVMEDWLKEAFATGEADTAVKLASRGIGPQQIADAVSTLYNEGMRAERLDGDPFDPAHIGRFLDRLKSQLSDFLKVARPLKGIGAQASTTLGALACAERSMQLVVNTPGMELDDWVRLRQALLGAWSKAVEDRFKDWQNGRFSQSERRCLGRLAVETSRQAEGVCRMLEQVKRADPELMDHARRTLRPLLSRVHAEMRARGSETFGALLLDARDLLERFPVLRRRIRERLTQLLVDEFQDTDRLQCDLIRMIALEGTPVHRPGLFVVGDPKQSIYGWRDADLQAYDEFVSEMLDQGGVLCRLSVNFRSTRPILEEVQRVIQPVMIGRRGVQPEFRSLVAARPNGTDSPGFGPSIHPIEYWISWKWNPDLLTEDPGTHSAEAAKLEAEAIARDMWERHRENGIPWREMALLLRNTGDLDTYLQALRENGIPYAVARDKSYFQRREIIDASALIRCVLDPNDHVAMLTLLRSSMVGVPDAAWIPLWELGFPELFTELGSERPDLLERARRIIAEAAAKLPEDIPGISRLKRWPSALVWALENIAALRGMLDREPFDVFIEKLRGLFLCEALEANRYLGAYRLANLERLFQSLLTVMDETNGDIQQLLRTLRSSVAQAAEAEEGRPKEIVEEAVQVMTIHRAKGLDFSHVYVAQLHKKSQNEAKEITTYRETREGFEYALFGASTLGFDQIEARRRALRAAELVRTLYVAMTRAKDRIVLAGKWPDHPDPVPPEKARNHMDLLQWRRPGPPIFDHRQPGDGGDHPGFLLDSAGARWIFPGRLVSEAPRPARIERRDGLPDPDLVSRQARELDARYASAGARMARPYARALSEEAHRALEDFWEERAPMEPRISPPGGREAGDGDRDRSRRWAMAVGTALHGVLERLDLDVDPTLEIKRQRKRLADILGLLVPADELQHLLSRARFILERFWEGPLLQKLREIRGRVIGREVPILLPPEEQPGDAVGFRSGIIDMVYREAASGRFVVVDFKTDSVRDQRELEALSRVYASQGSQYARALRESLELDEEPRVELWFLQEGKIIQVG